MAKRAVHFVERENEAGQQHGFFGFGKRQAFNFIPDRVESPRVVFLPGFFEIVLTDGGTAFGSPP